MEGSSETSSIFIWSRCRGSCKRRQCSFFSSLWFAGSECSLSGWFLWCIKVCSLGCDFFLGSPKPGWTEKLPGFMVLYYTNTPLNSVFVVGFSTSYPWLVRQTHEEQELWPGGGMLHKAQLFLSYLFMIRCGVGVLHLKGNGLCF